MIRIINTVLSFVMVCSIYGVDGRVKDSAVSSEKTFGATPMAKIGDNPFSYIGITGFV